LKIDFCNNKINFACENGLHGLKRLPAVGRDYTDLFVMVYNLNPMA
jgi:hypothetical protein